MAKSFTLKKAVKNKPEKGIQPGKTASMASKKKVKSAKLAEETSISIEKACEIALNKLRELEIDQSLQAEIQWCLGSFKADKNPIGLYQMADKALEVFQREKAHYKGITSKLITDISKALKP